ncbi:MAG: Tripartite tricarboxylate transporter substrate binding protein [Oscillospiraceae bacterium]|jgi:tripartite-type tricarboxylate transporter receptor subunit TctC
MKKIISFALALIMTLSLAACSSNSSAQSATESNAQTSSSQQSNTEQGSDASSWKPAHDITVRVPKAAGGAMDTVTRLATSGLNKTYGTTVLVTNMPGASGAIAATDLLNKQPDVCELMANGIVLYTLAPLFNPDIKINIDDYKFVSGLISEDFILCVNAASGIKNWDDLKAYAKNNRILVGCQSAGDSTHMLASAVFGESGIEWEAVSSDGSSKDVLALASNEVNVAIASESVFAQYVESGKVVPIMCFGNEDYTGYEGYTVPTAQSLGFDGVQWQSLNFLCTRAEVSDSDVDGMYNAIKAYSETDEFKDACKKANINYYICDGDTCKQIITGTESFCKKMYEKYYS